MARLDPMSPCCLPVLPVFGDIRIDTLLLSHSILRQMTLPVLIFVFVV